VDYGTPAQIEEIVQRVVAALGTPVFGRVDENKVITLTGALADGAYTIKYEDGDGKVTEIGSIVVGETEEPVVVLDIPWKEGWYINSSANPDKEDANYLATEEFIEIKDGYTYTLHSKVVGDLNMYVMWYSGMDYTTFISRTDSLNTIFNTSGGVYTVAPPSGAKYMRFRCNTSGKHTNWTNNIVLTRYKND
jgi:hypothetical protein